MSDLVGRVLSDRYRLVAPIGAGASAQVLLADDTRLKRRVAVKLLHAALAEDEGFLRRFRSEAQSSAALNHPHIVAVYDWGEDEGTPYLVTEFLGGGSLRGVLDLGRRLTPSQALLVGLETARALDHAHRRGFVHRDIKPANLLFGDEGRLRVADFGLARALAEAAWTEPAGAMVGTARYASPEQVRGERVDGRADVYALALVLVEAVTGRVPFAADTTIATLMARVDRVIDVPSDLGALRRVLVRAGQPDPEDRPDAGEFAVGLMAAAEELSRPTPLPLAGAITPGTAPADDRDPTSLPATAAAAPNGSTDPTTTIATVTAPAADDLDGEPEARRRRRRWPLAVAAVLVVAALAVGGVLAWQTLLAPSHEVPALVGLDLVAAEALIDENGWELDQREVREDDTAPGQILDQDPAAGESLREGDTVVLTVSLGQELRTVPTDLPGLTLEEALVRLDGAGLTAAEPAHRFDEEVEAGRVIRLADDTPTDAETGTPITLVVSDGPRPRVVPETEGATFEQACAALAQVQLGCEEGEAFSDTMPAGFVIGTDPAAGVEAARDSAVRVLVSQGPELIPVPEVFGQSVASAVEEIEAAGLVARVLENRRGVVINTNPSAGTLVRRGTTIEVFATQG
jgi:beta-lactam-binding protein with PASTA domain/tRNA A-37 threonylcarbamoyl transferase component Bud32